MTGRPRGRAAERDRHADVHRCRGVDPARPAARGGVRGHPQRASATTPRCPRRCRVDTRSTAVQMSFSPPSSGQRTGSRQRSPFSGVSPPSRGRRGSECALRIGLHTGEPVVEGGAYLGLDVNRAARICSAGHGGQILVSASTRDLVADEAEFEDLRGLQPSRRSRAPNGSSSCSRRACRRAFRRFERRVPSAAC